MNSSHPIPPKRFWILGAGRFGQIATAQIIRYIHSASITVIDKNLPVFDAGGIFTAVEGDGIAWLNARLGGDSPVDMIVPAIPVHVAAQWIKTRLADRYEIQPLKIPDDWLSRMPNAMKRPAGQVFVSHADFVCPSDCPEPKHLCTYTGKPRPMGLFRLLENLDFHDVLPVVVRSHQLLPGVGGLYPADMMQALDVVVKNSHRPMMIGTACRCHGVVDFIHLVPHACA